MGVAENDDLRPLPWTQDFRFFRRALAPAGRVAKIAPMTSLIFPRPAPPAEPETAAAGCLHLVAVYAAFALIALVSFGTLLANAI